MSEINFKYHVICPWGLSRDNKENFETIEEAQKYLDEVKKRDSNEYLEIYATPSVDISDISDTRNTLARPTPKTITVYLSCDGKEFKHEKDAALESACVILNNAVWRYRNERSPFATTVFNHKETSSCSYETSVSETVVFEINNKTEIDALRVFFSYEIEWEARKTNGRGHKLLIGESRDMYTDYMKTTRCINYIEKKFNENGSVIVKYEIVYHDDYDGEMWKETKFFVLDGKEKKFSYALKEGMKGCCKSCAEYKRCKYSAPDDNTVPRCYIEADMETVAENFDSTYSEAYTKFNGDNWVDPLNVDDFTESLADRKH